MHGFAGFELLGVGSARNDCGGESLRAQPLLFAAQVTTAISLFELPTVYECHAGERGNLPGWCTGWGARFFGCVGLRRGIAARFTVVYSYVRIGGREWFRW